MVMAGNSPCLPAFFCVPLIVVLICQQRVVAFSCSCHDDVRARVTEATTVAFLFPALVKVKEGGDGGVVNKPRQLLRNKLASHLLRTYTLLISKLATSVKPLSLLLDLTVK